MDPLKQKAVPLWVAGLLVVAATGVGAVLAQVGVSVGAPGDGEVLARLGGSAADGAAAHAHASDHGEATHDAHDAHDGDGHGPDYRRERFAEGEGSVPTREEARNFDEVDRIRILSDEDFAPGTGVRSGNGTLADPYVIEHLHVTGDLYIADTDACVVVREVYVSGQLTLNWNGPCVHLHHSHVRDLRVNENVERTGYATGGLIEHNRIDVVGQLRHFDGEFRSNTVGPGGQESLWDPVRETAPYLFSEDPRVANVDGFNQGWIHHNVFHGSVDLDFHGHHHGDGFFAPHSHYHGDDEDRLGGHDHTVRFTSVRFTDNRVVDHEGYGLRYEDRNHDADDRTATSEVLDALDEDHVHFTRIAIENNTLEGAGLWVDVFNADDDHHHRRNPGTLIVANNAITVEERPREGPAGIALFGPRYQPEVGIHVDAAKEVETLVVGNRLEFVEAEAPTLDPWAPFGGGDDGERSADERNAILLEDFRRANITVADNVARGFFVGVHGTELDEDTHWLLKGNDFGGAAWPVYYDKGSVENPPSKG